MIGNFTPKVGILLQFWGLHDSTQYAKDNFRVRRAEIRLLGETSPDLKYIITFDAAKELREGSINRNNDNSVLQDFFIEYKISNDFKISLGQFKAPNTVEGLAPLANLNFAERSIISRTFGDRRERGVMLSYSKDWIKSALMLSNGGNTNTSDTNSDKDINLRVDVNLSQNLSLGTFATYADGKTTTKYRNGLNAQYTYKKFTLASEGILGKTFDSKTKEQIPDTAYYLDFVYDNKTILSPALRYEHLDSNKISSDIYSFGLSYKLPEAKAKIQLNYSYLENATTNLGSPSAENGKKGGLVLFNFQVAI
jgi:phosphate-selective porin